MPVPGPRRQDGPLEGYRNPEGELPDRIHGSPYRTSEMDGRTPGTMERNRRGNVLAAGTIRYLYRQAVNYISPGEPYGWTSNGGDFLTARPFQITRGLRYFARSIVQGAGIDNTRLSELHTVVQPRVRSKPVSVGAGSKRSGPTVRNRLTSFGSRVTPINARSSSAEDS